jgi:hypothetical protein
MNKDQSRPSVVSPELERIAKVEFVKQFGPMKVETGYGRSIAIYAQTQEDKWKVWAAATKWALALQVEKEKHPLGEPTCFCGQPMEGHDYSHSPKQLGDGPEPQGEKRNEDEGRNAPCPLCGGIQGKHVPSCSTVAVQTEVGETRPEVTAQEVLEKCPICQLASPVSNWRKGYGALLVNFTNLPEIQCRVPSLQPTSSTQPTEGRASAEGERMVLISSSRLDLANNLAAMITEWIEGGIKGGTDWRNQLPTLIARRLERFEVSQRLPNIDTQRVEEKD